MGEHHIFVLAMWHTTFVFLMKHVADALPTCPLDLDDPSHGFKRVSWEDRLFLDESGAGVVATDVWSEAQTLVGTGQ